MIEQAAKDLRDAGHDVVVVTYGSEDVADDGDVVHVSRRGNVFSRYVRFMRAVRSRLSSDTTVLATDVFSVGIPVRMALIGKKNRFFLRLGGEWCWEDAVAKGRSSVSLRAFWSAGFSGPRRWFAKMNYRWICSRTARIFVTSDLLTSVLAAFIPAVASRFKTVPNLPQASSNIKRSNEAPHAPLRLIYVGRFAGVKNVLFIARVLKRLSGAGSGVVCTFVGNGGDLEDAKTILKDVSGMSFVGTKTQQEIAELLVHADVLVLPSLTDICPNSVVEALACGVPVVMTTEHGLSGFHGMIEVSPTDEEAWIDALMSLKDAESYERLRSSIAVPDTKNASLAEELQRV